MKHIVSFIVCVALLAVSARANDSTAEKAAGGLVLTRTDAIDMLSEDLFVSTALITVRYVFRNRTAADIRATVAFPMPDDDLAEREGGDVALPRDFATRVGGKPVTMSVERKAIVKGQDRSALLAELGIPLTGDGDLPLDRLGRNDRRRLMAAGLVAPEEGDDPTIGRLLPLWTIKETWHWDQVFPAGQDLVVEHRYVPGTGASVGTDLARLDYRNSAEGKAYAAQYCADAGFLAGVDRLARQAKAAAAAIPEYRVSYILKTGANWRAPIGRFRLVVDKGADANLVSFCADGVKKISPTRFEVRRTNWRPDRDLDVLIVAPRLG